MAFSSGSFTRTNGTNTGSTLWVSDKTDGTKILASRHDTHDQDLADGINACVLKLGTNIHATSAGTNTVTLALTPAIASYSAGQTINFKAGGTNTGAVTLNVSSKGAKAIQKSGAALVAGDIAANDIVAVIYDGTQFQMISPARTPVLTSGGITGASVAAGTSSARGTLELATDAEAVTGSDTARACTPANLTARMAAPGAIGGTTAANGTFATLTAGTVNASGDTSAADNAAMGYTSAEGLILTGQGSTNDVTIKNDADADVIKIATGATGVEIVGALTLGTDLSVANGGTGASTFTANNVLLGNGTSAFQVIAPGADGQVLTSTGSTWQSEAVAGGGWAFVSVVDASDQTTVVFENMVSGYDYLYQWEDVNPASDGDDSQMEIGVAGPTYRTSGYLGAYTGINNDTGATYSGTATANWLMTGNEDVGNTTATDFQIGHCHLINPANASFKTGMLGYTAHKSGSSQDYVWYYGRYNTAEANTCWKFEYDAGNVKNGKFMQYRRARS